MATQQRKGQAKETFALRIERPEVWKQWLRIARSGRREENQRSSDAPEEREDAVGAPTTT